MSGVMCEGPKAPKDPTKKRPGFCIIKDKQVAGSPQPDGTGTQFIYESDGRMIDAAKLIGGITDENMLGLLKTTGGFKKLVHSIGVSVESDDHEDVTFAFQMYGHSDPYASGTTLLMTVPGDGMEMVMTLSEYEWSDDDNIPGQIRFHFKKGGDLGKATVRFYLNDGFTAPPEEDDSPVDFNSDNYKKMIEKSLMNKGNNVRIKKALDKARNGEEVTLGFIGGSITQGAGAIPINKECYAYKIFKGFCDVTGRGYEDNVRYSKAGVGGTPSELGMLRYERDILKNGLVQPDIVVVEFAVNDEGDETKGECYDSLVRKIYNGPGSPAVILLFAVFSNDYNLQDRLSPVGYAYNLPMVSTLNSVKDQFYLKAEEGRVVKKSQYFYDCFHPTNTGHTIMADGVINLLKIVDAEEYDSSEVDVKAIAPPIGGEFEPVILLDKKGNLDLAVISEGDFTDTDKVLQAVERDLDLGVTPQLPNNWYYAGSKDKEGKPFVMDIKCSALLVIFKDSADPKDGNATVLVDGKEAIKYNPHEVGWCHCNPIIALRGAENTLHHVEIKPDDPEKNVTILGFGVCN